MILTSKNNPLIKATASLKEKKGRKEHGLFLVEGAKMVRECLKSSFEIERVFIAESYHEDIAWLCGLSDKVTFVSDGIFQFLSDEKTPQGILCRVKIPAWEMKPPKDKCLFLDGVADPGNVGTIIRTANAAGYNEIYLTRACADPYSPKSVRASMSGVFFTKLYFGQREELLDVLKDTPILAADMDGENVFDFVPPSRFALVIGNEANGVSAAVEEAADKTIRIPMRSSQESLNAAVAAGVSMYLLAKEKFV
jgi:TrmH family RNA methyltransferase